jgi:hypothetical protein
LSALKVLNYFSPQGWRKSVPDFGDEDEVLPFVIPDEQIIEPIRGWLIGMV